MDQEAPSELDVHADVSAGTPTYRLGFRSAVRNIGAGPLTVEGARADMTTPTMTVDQIIDRVSGPPRVIAGVGEMEYSVSPDHSHWHYLQFDRYQLQRYELRPAGDNDVLVADQKTGFCLGDRYRVDTPALPAAPAEPVFPGRLRALTPRAAADPRRHLGRLRRRLLRVPRGSGPALDGLPDGRYVLVHRVNANEKLREISYANNAASVLLDLRWENGQPQLHALASCPDTDRCDDASTGGSGLEIPISPAS